MPAGRKPSFTCEEFLDAAIGFADAHGLEQLTLRALGVEVGASTTAVYRYFQDKEALVAAMRERLLTGIAGLVPPDDLLPEHALMAGAQAFRETVRQHPCLGQIMALPATNGHNGAAVQTYVLTQLRNLGLRGARLARGYQQIESFVAGSSMFDFADAPAHLTDRFARLEAMKDADLSAALHNPAAVDRNNEDAFTSTLRSIIGALIAESASQNLY